MKQKTVIMLMLAIVLFLCFSAALADAETNGIPTVRLFIDAEELQKVNESPDHSYLGAGAAVRIDVPEGYEGEFGEIDPETTAVYLPLAYISGRGNSTWLEEKKSYKIKLENRTDLPGAQEDDIASGICGTCWWRIDAKGNLVIGPLEGGEGTLDNWTSGAGRPWHAYRESITSASFEGTVHAQTCLAFFYHCYSLERIDLSSFDTAQAEMDYLFADCYSLRSVTVGDRWQTDADRGADTLFHGCSGTVQVIH